VDLFTLQPPAKKRRPDGDVENNIDGLYVGFTTVLLLLLLLVLVVLVKGSELCNHGTFFIHFYMKF